MKKWLKFFGLSFFSNESAKDGIKRGYANFFLGLVLALIFIFAGVIGGDMLPFGAHYNRAEDFSRTVQQVFANSNVSDRVLVMAEGDSIKAKIGDGDYTNALLVDTFKNTADKEKYSVGDYQVVVDTRPATALAEIDAYCVAKDDATKVISYEEFLTLNNIARLNFDFKMTYTGNELILDDAFISTCRAFVDGVSDELKTSTQALDESLAQESITKAEYNRAIYELYFANYYPEITAYESTSKVPLLRNYYYHQYINNGAEKYLFVFDDYVAGSFTTKGGIKVPFFYGVYNDVENGVLVSDSLNLEQAQKVADDFIKTAYKSTVQMSVYVYAMNVIRVLPFIALMPIVVGLLLHSILKLRGVETCLTFGASFKVVGSFVWGAGLTSAIATLILAFFVQRSVLNVLPLVLFFIALLARAVFFMLEEIKKHKQEIKNQVAEEGQLDDNQAEA